MWSPRPRCCYSIQGDLSTTQETTLSLRNATVIQEDFSQNQTLSDTQTSNTITVTSTDTNTQVTDVDLELGGTLPPPQIIVQSAPPPRFIGGGNTGDPLAQTFTVDDETGIFVTKVDFSSEQRPKGSSDKFHIRETKLGQPLVKLFHSLKFHLILIRSTSVMMVQLQLPLLSNHQSTLEGETEYDGIGCLMQQTILSISVDWVRQTSQH